ncbi:MAG: hypothetical protein M1822_008375 [Bathelium mastoideum]|nr:MAG: hypothetical protein M1822_008375 [Bathelium mastoideum]
MVEELTEKSLRSNLRSPVTSEQHRTNIISRLWRFAPTESDVQSDAVRAYFEYYGEECCGANIPVHSVQAPNSHQDILNIVELLIDKSGKSKSDVLEHYRDVYDYFFEEQYAPLSGTLELAARLWLMVNIRSPNPDLGGYVSFNTALPWPDEKSIAEILSDHFNADCVMKAKHKAFSKRFTLYHLEKIAGFQILWTDNLLDHLRLVDDAIYIFHNVTVLRHLLTANLHVYPDSFLQETLNSISLLLPSSIIECNTWLKSRSHHSRPSQFPHRRRRRHQIDSTLRYLPSAPREVDAYSHWKERLLVIEEAFEEHEPATLSQWYHDQRKKAQSYFFWIGVWGLVLTTLFGFVSMVASIVQAWASVQALQRVS